MKKITLLIIVLFFNLQTIISQTLTHSTSQSILADNSVACEIAVGNTRVVNDNTFFRSFKLSDFSITSDYDITSVEYGIEKMANAPAGGYPVKVSIYTTDSDFPTGTLTLINEVTEQITDQTLTIHSTPITATIPAGSEIVIGVSIESDAVSNGGSGQVVFQIGSNQDGENDDSYIMASGCSLTTPVTFTSQGRPDINVVMNIQGTSATASVGDLELVSFNYYPNPVKDKLNMTAKETISSVSLYNVLGQEIRKIKPSQLKASLDLASLSAGTYMVKAYVNDRVGAFTIIKE